ncbi:MAG: hypothetical protein R3C42_00630 [Parvularculaceae bacterium]
MGSPISRVAAQRQTLLEQASEPVGEGWPVCGRRFTLDWSAKAGIRALERALRTQPALRPRLIVAADMFEYLEHDRPQWRARIADKFSARFDIIRSETLKSGAYDIAE